jgi:prolyl oligopeptidase
MMKNLFLLPLAFALQSLSLFSQQTEFPPSPVEPVRDTFYGTVVVDNYRYLENLRSGRVQKWVQDQNEVTRKYMRKMTTQSNAFGEINANATSDYSLPNRHGDYYFHYIFDGWRRGASLYYQKKITDTPLPLVDPLTISTKDEISLGMASVSKDSKYLAYQFSRGGSDWEEVNVIRMSDKRPMDDHLTQLKFSDINWQGQGFYYTRFRVKDSLSSQGQEEICYHQLGDPQEKDKLVFARSHKSFTQLSVFVTSDEQYLIIREENRKLHTLSFFLKDNLQPDATIKPLIINSKLNLDLLDSHQGKIYALTSTDSTAANLVVIDPLQPYQWESALPPVEKMQFRQALLLNSYIAVVYQAEKNQRIVLFSYDGAVKHVENIYSDCVVGELSANPGDPELIYNIYNYLVPPLLYSLDLKTLKNELIQKTTVTYNFTDFEIKDVEYPSRDGTMVPMTIMYKKGLKRNGSNPTLLKAYGGFGIISQPYFDPGLVYYLMGGGVFAFAKIRGGGEKGAQWHRMGSGRFKQNSFDDFISAAEFLIKEMYTSPAHLAITGASNGGLVVGAAITQRPDLFSAAVPVVGVFDMIRFEKFTIGSLHTGEYGTVQTPDGFRQLLAYSPIHHIKPGVNYPATLIMTAENDDRVPPFHAYKFAAALQNNPGQTNPILLQVEKNAGHHGSQVYVDLLNNRASLYSFVWYYTK